MMPQITKEEAVAMIKMPLPSGHLVELQDVLNALPAEQQDGFAEDVLKMYNNDSQAALRVFQIVQASNL